MKKDPYAPLRDQMDQAPTYWRSLEHRELDPEVTKNLDVEFPTGLTRPGDVNRRDALKLAGASMALGSLLGCDYPLRRPKSEILPFVRAPEKVIPGVKLEYATAMPRAEGAMGLVVEANDGRPTKIEGNPRHGSTLGKSDVWAQAEVLRLYDPERARAPRKGGEQSTWEAWDAFAEDTFGPYGDNGGQGLAFLLEETEGPTTRRQVEAMVAKWPQAKVYRWDPLAPDAMLQGAQLAFGPGIRPGFDLTKAKTIAAIDSDFLVRGPEHLRLAWEFGTSRRVSSQADVEQMKRLYVAEATWTVTGTNADHRLRIAQSALPGVLTALARALHEGGVDLGPVGEAVAGATAPAGSEKFVAGLARELIANRGAAVVLVGERLGPAGQALAMAINAALGGEVQVLRQGPAVARQGSVESLKALTAALDAGQVETLVIVEANPVYTAPGGVPFAQAVKKAKVVVHAGTHLDETAMAATWHVPVAHFLETWGDAIAWDGTVSLIQPLILPLFGARPLPTFLGELLAAEAYDAEGRKYVETTWRGDGAPLASELAWRKALHEGVVEGTQYPVASPAVRGAEVAEAVKGLSAAMPSEAALDVVAVTGHQLDGRLTNVSWVMELPETMSKLCWDNAIYLSPSTAKALGIESQVKANAYQADVVELSAGGKTLRGPVFVLPGIANHTAVVTKGFGRSMGEVAKGVGFDVYPFLAEGEVVRGATLKKTGETQPLCSTQDHFSVPGNPFREMTFAEMTAQAADAPERKLGLGSREYFRQASQKEYVTVGEQLFRKGDMPENLMAPRERPEAFPRRPLQPIESITYEGQQWGMVIDLSSCIGCNACTIACQAENNIATVGREQVLLGRELHWIRVDRYFSGDVEQPLAVHQPLACMQCENAPCEPVCPVGATVHDDEGINAMAYNRCIGTRYCSNNCPYKVRRFNYLDYTHTGDVYVEPYWKERMRSLKLQRNPDVTVRYRGVMEKCTYCTQRIEEAKVAAKQAGNDRKALPDGAVTPACAQTCPTDAIVFGNINDPDSRVAKLKTSPRNYEMLQELNVRPRTTYLARIRNVNEELV